MVCKLLAIEVFVRPYVKSDANNFGSIAAGIDVSDSRKFENSSVALLDKNAENPEN